MIWNNTIKAPKLKMNELNTGIISHSELFFLMILYFFDTIVPNESERISSPKNVRLSLFR